MDSLQLKQIYTENLKRKSGLEQHRPYLGMSSISQCPNLLYRQFLNGRGEQTLRDHWYCRQGYNFQHDTLELLGAFDPRLNKIEPLETEVIAGFDARFRGHTDWETKDGDLVEIKSVHWDIFTEIYANRRALHSHYDQVMCYMKHGGWKFAHIIYVARDVPGNAWSGDIIRECGGLPIWIIGVRLNQDVSGRLDNKARLVLAAIDKGEAPDCLCGRCR